MQSVLINGRHIQGDPGGMINMLRNSHALKIKCTRPTIKENAKFLPKIERERDKERESERDVVISFYVKHN